MRIEVIHEIPEDQRHCPHDGQILTEINEVVSEQVDIIPAQLRVIRHIRKQYACACGQCIQTAPLPGQPIPKSMASPGLLAHIAVSKYQDALPLYRQEQILQRVGVAIPRATLANESTAMCGAIWIDTHGTTRNYSVDTINYNKPGGTVLMAAPHIAVLSIFCLSPGMFPVSS